MERRAEVDENASMTRLFVSLALAVWGLGAFAAGGDASSTATVLAQARALVDNNYGNRGELEQAAILVSNVLAGANPPSDAFVQAARITIKGGYIVADQFETRTPHIAEYFIDRALAADPDNVRAISLKAQILMMNQRDLPGAYGTLQLGLSKQFSYPWLHLDLGRYYEDVHDYRAAMSEYAIVVNGGCSNTDLDQRRAFTSALASQAFLLNKQEALARQYAEAADQCRNPKDAWTLGNFAQLFNQMALFDDALVYARKALIVMNYGVGRRELAMALYGKAAQLSIAGNDPTKTLVEANGMKFGRDEVISWFDQSRSSAHAFSPAVTSLLRRAP